MKLLSKLQGVGQMFLNIFLSHLGFMGNEGRETFTESKFGEEGKRVMIVFGSY